MRFLDKPDWSTEEDFDFDDSEWIDITHLASEYEIQYAPRHGVYRHRLMRLGSPWRKGREGEAS